MQIIYHLGLLPLQAPVDVHMSMLQGSGKAGGYTVIPPLFMDWKSGEAARDSDISPGDRKGNYNIKDGIRGNLEMLLEEQRKIKSGIK
ncbi:hypothetical protein NEOLI_005347 [Neolecta irregularis DAH-3]|uniref:Uncharacterized protein n=1 Tax=Neolecta irregularis (strain DAH-3) TaxID=1198029 RepID=A0A1U7LGQ9_NEOID|nr:hypothetical protein NEOLI_005347 [Neolecta irregularis DAH-3]|eukprot:OLL21711.1 hypothetical protein NEOLI_005347 [Neolecta irregularis DAH-3]